MFIFPLISNADNFGTCGENVNWSYDETTQTLVISGTGTMKRFSLGGVPWNVFKNEIKALIVEDGVTGIGGYSFYCCTSLSSVTLPNSLLSIGDNAFYYCTSLEEIVIPNSVVYIGMQAFEYCLNLIKVNMSDNVKNIGAFTFGWCEKLEIINLPSQLTRIESSIFSNCISLKNIGIPKYVRSIGSQAFNGCENLSDISLPNCLEEIGESAFQNCKTITHIAIPDEVTSVGNNAFGGCTNLSYISIGKKVTSFGNTPFYDCSNLVSVCLRCPVIENWFRGFNKITALKLDEGVNSIKDYAFQGCTGIVSVSIPNSLTSIGYKAFDRVNPKKVLWFANTPPNGYQELQGIINYVSNDSYTMLNSKTKYSFLSSIFEVDGIKYVPTNPSEKECDAIDCIYNSSSENTIIDKIVYYKGIAMNVVNVMPYLCSGNIFIKNISWKFNGSIPNYTFHNCLFAENVTLGSEVATIGHYAFANCTRIKEVQIPNSTRIIGEYAFQNCTYSKLSIPPSVMEIKNFAFSGCSELSTFTIVDRNTPINLGSNGSSPLFSSCPLDSVYIGGDILYQTNGDKGYSPFYRNTYLRTVVINDEETEISENEFYGCSSLKKVKMGDGIMTIGNRAFSGCSSITEFSFGSKLASIGEEAFSDCSSIASLVSNAQNPPSCGTQALDDINKWNCTLVVPIGCKTNYQSAEQWKDFFFIVEDNGDGSIEEPSTKKCATPTINYQDGMITFTCDTKGVGFISEISSNDIQQYQGKEINLTATYYISVYATMNGYLNSDIATATLCWIDAEPKTEGITGIVSKVRAFPVLIQSDNGILHIMGTQNGTRINVYNAAGVEVGEKRAIDGTTTIASNLKCGEVAIVKIGDKTIKIIIK